RPSDRHHGAEPTQKLTTPRLFVRPRSKYLKLSLLLADFGSGEPSRINSLSTYLADPGERHGRSGAATKGLVLVSAISERGMFMISRGTVIPVETGAPAEFLDVTARDLGVLDHLALGHGAIIGRAGEARLDLCLSGENFDRKSLARVI